MKASAVVVVSWYYISLSLNLSLYLLLMMVVWERSIILSSVKTVNLPHCGNVYSGLSYGWAFPWFTCSVLPPSPPRPYLQKAPPKGYSIFLLVVSELSNRWPLVALLYHMALPCTVATGFASHNFIYRSASSTCSYYFTYLRKIYLN